MSAGPKAVAKQTIVSALKELSDEVYQRRVWVIGSPTEVSSMNEATAALYNDSGLDLALDANAPVFSEKIDQELRELRAMLRDALTKLSHRSTQDVIANREWAEVRLRARKLLEAIAK